ncbi:MAG: amino acid ABC transporter substrate-binding protein [Desulfobacteraceae bacterium]|nr:amino acid ABC transporter substrate-binding protein [Desulfobacteraceae bacterium]
MKKLHTFAFVVATIFFFGLICGNNAYPKNTLVVTAAESIYAKKIDRNGQDRLAGPAIQLITTIFKDLGIPVETIVYPWQRAIKMLKKGKIDAVLTFFHTEERAEYSIFTDGYDEVKTCVFVKKGKSFPFTKWNDLIGLKGVMIRGRSEGPKWDAFRNKNLNIEPKDSLAQMILMIDSERCNYSVDKEYDIIMEAKRMGHYNKIEILPFSINTNQLRIGISKKSPFVKYVPEINKKITTLRKNGVIKQWIHQALEDSVK